MKLPSSKLVGILLAFLLIGVVMTSVAIDSLLGMVTEINEHSKEVTFDKGAYYLFGGGIFFLILSLGSLASFFIPDRHSKVYVKTVGLSMVVSLLLVFIIPGIVHHYVESTLTQDNYELCENKSSQWLFVKTIVYSRSHCN